MCVQRHPCKFKCFQNYNTLCNEFPVFDNKRHGDDFICDCNCKRIRNIPCDFDNKQNEQNWGQDNDFDCGQNNWLVPNKQQKNCFDKFHFVITGTVKFDGSC